MEDVDLGRLEVEAGIDLNYGTGPVGEGPGSRVRPQEPDRGGSAKLPREDGGGPWIGQKGV